MKLGAGVPSKFLPVPESLAGERCDNGIAKMLGISRTKAQELISEGLVKQDNQVVGKSDRLNPDAVVEVELVEGPPPLEVRAEDVAELGIVFEDEHIVVINTPPTNFPTKQPQSSCLHV